MRRFAIAGILGLCLTATMAYLACDNKHGGQGSHPTSLPRKPAPEQRVEGFVVTPPDNRQKSTQGGEEEIPGK
jgi:hypothetical protein